MAEYKKKRRRSRAEKRMFIYRVVAGVCAIALILGVLVYAVVSFM